MRLAGANINVASLTWWEGEREGVGLAPPRMPVKRLTRRTHAAQSAEWLRQRMLAVVGGEVCDLQSACGVARGKRVPSRKFFACAIVCNDAF